MHIQMLVENSQSPVPNTGISKNHSSKKRDTAICSSTFHKKKQSHLMSELSQVFHSMLRCCLTGNKNDHQFPSLDRH